MEFITSEVFLLFLTFAIYHFAQLLQHKTKLIILNPILISICFLICFLKCTSMEYETYHQALKYIDFLLKPAVVALGVPLYMQLSQIKKQLLPIFLSQLAGCIVGMVSVAIVALLLGASPEVVYSLIPKSVTTPIAVEVSKSIGGIPALTTAIVIFTGILGAIIGFRILGWARVKSSMGQGLAMGAASHAVGTSRAMEISSKYGAYSGVGLTINGILTALLAPSFTSLLKWCLGF